MAAFLLATATQVVTLDTKASAFVLSPFDGTPSSSCLQYWRVEDVVPTPDWWDGAAGPSAALSTALRQQLRTGAPATPSGASLPTFFRLAFIPTGTYLSTVAQTKVDAMVTTPPSLLSAPAPTFTATQAPVLTLVGDAGAGAIFMLAATYRAVLRAGNVGGGDVYNLMKGVDDWAVIAVQDTSVREGNPVQAVALCTNMTVNGVKYGVTTPGTLAPGCGVGTTLWGTCACHGSASQLNQVHSLPWYQACGGAVAFGYWYPNAAGAVALHVTPVATACPAASFLRLTAVPDGPACVMPPPASTTAPSSTLSAPAPSLTAAAAAQVASLNQYRSTAMWVAGGIGLLLLLAFAGLLVHAKLLHSKTVRLARVAAKVEGGLNVAARRVQTARMAARQQERTGAGARVANNQKRG